jgi:hypothetical protein
VKIVRDKKYFDMIHQFDDIYENIEGGEELKEGVICSSYKEDGKYYFVDKFPNNIKKTLSLDELKTGWGVLFLYDYECGKQLVLAEKYYEGNFDNITKNSSKKFSELIRMDCSSKMTTRILYQNTCKKNNIGEVLVIKRGLRENPQFMH